jgi:hypothetical protein
MQIERAFRSGNKKYYVVISEGFYVVRRQDWLSKTFIGYANNLAEAMELIKQDAKSSAIRAA